MVKFDCLEGDTENLSNILLLSKLLNYCKKNYTKNRFVIEDALL